MASVGMPPAPACSFSLFFIKAGIPTLLILRNCIMDNPLKQQLTEDLSKVKAQSGDRLQRIQEILKTAFSEAASEMKAGGKEVGSTSKESFRNAVQTVANRKPAEATVTVEASVAQPEMAEDRVVVESVDATMLDSQTPTAMPEPSTLKILEDLLKATGTQAKSIAREQYDKLEAELPERSQQLQSKAQDWDEQLTQRYGDDYAGLKQRFAKAFAWYQEKLNAGKALNNKSVGKKEEKADELGVKVAQKEEVIKEQIGQALRTITVNVRS